jgi:hypothetical protein
MLRRIAGHVQLERQCVDILAEVRPPPEQV